jgi:GR25 family glycosyltransferase involved in LPS biosynthesis
MPAIPIFVLSLQRAADRRVSICRHLDNLGLAYELMDAVDGEQLSFEDRNRLSVYESKVYPGELGCYISHINALERIVTSAVPFALVLEDDARLNPKLAPFLKSGNINFNADYCMLDCRAPRNKKALYYDADTAHLMAPDFPVYELNEGPAGTHAYLISQTGAQRRLKCAYPMRQPIDCYDKLEYRPSFLACVRPKGAYASEHTQLSLIMNIRHSPPIRLRWLRRFHAYPLLRDWLKLRPLKMMLHIPRLRRAGELPAGRRWRPMPTGTDFILDI